MRVIEAMKTFLRQGDIFLLALCCVSSGFGMVLIASASGYQGSRQFLLVQGTAAAIGVVLFIVCSFLDLEAATERWKWIAVFNVLAICALIFWGVEGDTGNKSWIRFSWFPVGVQPAEIVKITFVLLLAKQMAAMQARDINRPSSVFGLGAHLLFICTLIFVVSSDAGMVLVYFVMFVIMLFTAGVKLRWFAGTGAVAALLIALFWQPLWDRFPVYMRQRILVIFDHALDPLGVGWHQSRSILAIGSGRLTGQGLFQGKQTQSAASSSLPARHTDFIFAVAGEELGMVGCLVILLLLTAIIVRCVYVGLTARSALSALVCVGFAGMLFCQVALNVAMCLYLAPVVGLTLPFFSYGGSSVVTLFAAMGMVSGVKMRFLPSWLRDRRDIAPPAEAGQ